MSGPPRTRPAVLSRLAPLVTRLAGRSDAPADAVREVESRIYGVLQWPATRILHVAGWEALFHVLAVAEVWMVLRLLPGGEQLTLVDAFLMESAGRFVTIAFKFVPYRLGIDEMGSGAVAQVLGLPPATGVTLALVRRLRILVQRLRSGSTVNLSNDRERRRCLPRERSTEPTQVTDTIERREIAESELTHA